MVEQSNSNPDILGSNLCHSSAKIPLKWHIHTIVHSCPCKILFVTGLDIKLILILLNNEFPLSQLLRQMQSKTEGEHLKIYKCCSSFFSVLSSSHYPTMVGALLLLESLLILACYLGCYSITTTPLQVESSKLMT